MTLATSERPGLDSTELEIPDLAPIEVEDANGHYEVIDGRREQLPPMGTYEAHLAGVLNRRLGDFVEAQQLGTAEVEMLFGLAPGRTLQRRPDVAFVSYQRWARGRKIPRANAWPVVPDLAIEVVSPSDYAVEIAAKLRDYFRVGLRQVWIIFSDQGWVYVYDAPKLVRILDRADVLDGGALLPGFRLPLSELFEPEDEAAGDQPPDASAGASE